MVWMEQPGDRVSSGLNTQAHLEQSHHYSDRN
jgi:hypothetical protein